MPGQTADPSVQADDIVDKNKPADTEEEGQAVKRKLPLDFSDLDEANNTKKGKKKVD